MWYSSTGPTESESSRGANEQHDAVDYQVHLQTQQVVKQGFVQMIISVVRHDGILALYNGLTASVLRQVGRYDVLYNLSTLYYNS